MKHSAEFQRCMLDLDVVQARRLWAFVFPHLPQPGGDDETLLILHHARTQSFDVPFIQRAYSHRYLLDHGFPSGLPDELKPKAERVYPRVVGSVGISVNSKYPDLRAAVHGAMSNAVLEAYADKQTDPGFVKARMMQARRKITESS